MNMLDELGSIVLDTHRLGSFSDDEFYHFCLDNRNLKFERDAQSNIILIPNSGGIIGNYNAEILAEIGIWSRISKTGICFDSSTAFKLPNSAVRSPDAAWIQSERWNTLSNKEKEQFPPLCPDFVIEIKSSSDSLLNLKDKMKEWMANGCKLAWLINPEESLTYCYYDNQEYAISFEEILSGQSILKGFEIQLKDIFSK
ncbi:MAG: Uma2 family endonuclease [Bacteroidetes bacterium]|nr:MAG: Uma2 family endonuclease [Bacteroidota bacterium]